MIALPGNYRAPAQRHRSRARTHDRLVSVICWRGPKAPPAVHALSVTDSETLHPIVTDTHRIALVMMNVRTGNGEHVNHFSVYAGSRRVAMICRQVFCIANDRFSAVWGSTREAPHVAIYNHVATAR